jgi:hypothetical protein
VLQKSLKLANYHLIDPGEVGDLANEIVALINLYYPETTKEAIVEKDHSVPALGHSESTAFTGMRALTSMRM